MQHTGTVFPNKCNFCTARRASCDRQAYATAYVQATLYWMEEYTFTLSRIEGNIVMQDEDAGHLRIYVPIQNS